MRHLIDIFKISYSFSVTIETDYTCNLSLIRNIHCTAMQQPTKNPQDISFGPFTVLMGILLGTVFSIAFSLSIVCFVFWYLQDEAPRLLAEFDSLLISTGIFTALSIVAGLSFFGSLKRTAWRHLPMTFLWLGLLSAGRYYWPQ
jgi:hypothetical protein